MRPAAAASGQQDQPAPRRSALTVAAPFLPFRSFPAAISRALSIANGLGGDPGSHDVDRHAVTDTTAEHLAARDQTAADGVGSGRDDQLGVGHPVVGELQRPGHARGPGPGDQQDVRVPRAGGEEDAEPVDVVDGAEQSLDLPLLAAVRPGVHVPDVDAAAKRRGTFASAPRTAAISASVCGSRGTTSACRVSPAAPVRSRPPTRRTRRAGPPHSARTGCTFPGPPAPGRR